MFNSSLRWSEVRYSPFGMTAGARLVRAMLAVTSMLVTDPAQCLARDGYRPGPWGRGLVVGPDRDNTSKIFRGSAFVDLNLEGAVFDGSDLSSTLFVNCLLKGASFRGVCLADATFENCDGGDQADQRFVDVDFTEADISGLKLDSTAKLSPAQLMSTRSYKTKRLSGCALLVNTSGYGNEPPRYDFRSADLTRTRLDGDFTGADFDNARVDEVQIGEGAVRFRQLRATRNFRMKQMRNMHLRFLDDDCDFTGIDLNGSTIELSGGSLVLDGAFVLRCELSGTCPGSVLTSTASYREGRLMGLRVANFDLRGIDLSRQNLTGCSFLSCRLSGARLDDAVITGGVFGDGADHQSGLSVEQIKSTWNYKNDRMEGITLPKAIADALAGEKTGRGAQRSSSEIEVSEQEHGAGKQ